MHYLIEMKAAPTAALLSREEAISVAERFVLPTLETCTRLAAEGRIVGGPRLGAMSFAFVVRGESPEEIEDLAVTLPLWPRVETTVTPLGTFADRLAVARQRLAALQAVPAAGTPPESNRPQPTSRP